MLLNCSKADWRFSVISLASTSGGGRFSESSRLTSSKKVMSRTSASSCKRKEKTGGMKVRNQNVRFKWFNSLYD